MSVLVLPFTLKASITYPSSLLEPQGEVQTSLDDTTYVLSIQEAVIAKFGTSSPMVEVARCESTFRQFDSDGNVLRGDKNKDDRGVFQINTKYHLKKSIELGYDIDTVQGNLDYAKYLYDHQGLKPWVWSKDCWSGGTLQSR